MMKAVWDESWGMTIADLTPTKEPLASTPTHFTRIPRGTTTHRHLFPRPLGTKRSVSGQVLKEERRPKRKHYTSRIDLERTREGILNGSMRRTESPLVKTGLSQTSPKPSGWKLVSGFRTELRLLHEEKDHHSGLVYVLRVGVTLKSIRRESQRHIRTVHTLNPV